MGRKAVNPSICEKIDRAADLNIRLKAIESELDEIKAEIKAEMERIGVTEGEGQTGIAKLGSSTTREWDATKLLKILGPDEFAKYCPPKPDGARLGKLMEADFDMARIFENKKAFTAKVSLRLSLGVKEGAQIDEQEKKAVA